MKAEVFIQNGQFKITMFPENKFEETLIEDAETESRSYDIRTTFSTASFKSNHKVVIEGTVKEQP